MRTSHNYSPPACLPACLPGCLPAWLPACLPACLPADTMAAYQSGKLKEMLAGVGINI